MLLTDGNEYGGLSTNPRDAGVTAGAENNIAFYTVGIGFVDASFLTQLAEGTRGQTYLYSNSNELQDTYTYLATYLRTQYVVNVQTDLEPDGAEHTLTVTVPQGSADTTFNAPDLYPQLAFQGLPGAALQEPAEVTAQVSAARGLGENTLSLDGQALQADFAATGDNSAAATVTIDPYTLAPGTHTVILSATDAEGGNRDLSADFEVADLPPVFQVTGIAEGDVITTGTINVARDR